MILYINHFIFICCFYFDCHLQCFMGFVVLSLRQPCTFFFSILFFCLFLYICNVVIDLVSGWFGSWLITIKLRLFKNPYEKNKKECMHCCTLLHIGNKLKARPIFFFFVQQMIDGECFGNSFETGHYFCNVL